MTKTFTSEDYCDRCGGKIDHDGLGTYMVAVHMATYGHLAHDYKLDGEVVANKGTWVHGDTWRHYCGECYKDLLEVIKDFEGGNND